MNFLDGYYRTGSKMRSKKARQEFYCAIIEYYYEGKEPSFATEQAEIGYEGIRFSLEKAHNGRKGGLGNGEVEGEVTAEVNGEVNAKQTPNETRTKEEEEEGKTNVLEPPIVPQRDTPFWQSCLLVLNETLGTTYTTMPEKCRHMLERSSAAYTPADVRKMIAYKRDEWRAQDRKSKTTYSKNLTPNTLFSPDHFEQYMHQSKDTKEANDYAKYDR